MFMSIILVRQDCSLSTPNNTQEGDYPGREDKGYYLFIVLTNSAILGSTTATFSWMTISAERSK